MASGRLGTANITTTSDTTIYTCPASNFAVVSVSLCNRGTSAIAIRMAVAAAGTPAVDEYIEFDTSIAAKGVFERTGLVLDAGKKIVVTTGSAGTLSVVAYGIETSTT